MDRIEEGVNGKEEKLHGNSGATQFGYDLTRDWKLGCDPIRVRPILGVTYSEIRVRPNSGATQFGSGVSAAKKRLSSKPQ